MTNERRQDVFLIALVISVALHIVLMIWAKPQVMTHTVANLPHAVRRGPVRVKEAPPLAEPVAIESVKDETAKKLAPAAEGAAAAPVAEEALPMPSGHEEVLLPDAPELTAKVDSDFVLPVAKPSAQKMFTELFAPVKTESEPKPAVMSYGGSDLVLPVAPPELPKVEGAVARSAEPARPPMIETSREPVDFTPVSEVLANVDEKFVEKEKAAVSELLNVDTAMDITKAVDVRLAKAKSGPWTYFRVTFTPKANLPAVPKDLVVLIDASGSIGRDRLGSCRKAAKKILRTATNTGDRFNLVAFRDRFTYAFGSWQECNAASFAAGDRWLNGLAAHGRTDVFASIRSVLTLPRDPKRPLIAMVVTDGDANTGVSETAEILSRFSRLNDGLVSVYMYGVRGTANRELIEILTRGNRGESVIYDSWKRWDAGEGLEGLSERFRDPILTDLRVVLSVDTPARVYPALLRNLYRGNSTQLVGRIAGNPREVAFALKGLSGDYAYEGFFRLPFSSAAEDPGIADEYETEADVDFRMHRGR